MAKELSSRERTLLAKLLHEIHSKTSANALILELQRANDTYPKRTLQKLLVDFAKANKMAEYAYKEGQEEFKNINTAFHCLQRFLELYANVRKNAKSNSIDTIDEVEEISHQKLNGTQNTNGNKNANGNNELSNNVKEILKKVVQAAKDGVRKSSQLSHLQESNHNNSTQMTEEMRIHSQLYFSKAILDSVTMQAIQTNCSVLPAIDQERLLIDDLIYCFIGLPGDYITPNFSEDSEQNFDNVSFKISDQMDISLRNIAADMLPMASHFSIVQKFAQWSDKVNNPILQALGEMIQKMLIDYRSSIVQLEHEKNNNNLTLHKLHYLIRPNAHKMTVLYEIVKKLINKSNLNGGLMLSLLFNEITLQTGDSMSQKMLIKLSECAAVPYIEILEKWILKGVIIDPTNQFFVIDHVKELNKPNQMDQAHYWESRYTKQSDRIPCFLEKDADIILRTGKYLNVIRQCGKQMTLTSNQTKLMFSPLNQNHSMFIKQAYHNASKTLLDLLVSEQNLMGHISSVKRYFLLQQGDLITQFMDASDNELSKNVDKVLPLCLNNLLQLIVRLSSAKYDPCIEHLYCDLFTTDLQERISRIHDVGQEHANDLTTVYNSKLTGTECFAFGYNAEWPVSIVLNQWALSQYQMLFRLLFYCKHVERQLGKVWIENCAMNKRMQHHEINVWRPAFALRQRMLNVIQHLENFMMIEVIEPNWHIFTEKMKTVQNVDDVILIHHDFLHICLQNCCLSYPKILGFVMNICSVCLKFSTFIRSDAGIKITPKWQLTIDKLSTEFDIFLSELLNNINGMSSEQLSGSKLINLVHRINFNGYYSEHFEQIAIK